MIDYQDLKWATAALFRVGQVYDEYTAKIREALGRIAADKFPPEKESRLRERVADRPPTPELITEVAR